MLNDDCVRTVDEMRALLIETYNQIPKGSREAYILLAERAKLRDPDLSYDERMQRYRNIANVLDFSPDGGLAGRDINEY
jgi:hypothetical protein